MENDLELRVAGIRQLIDNNASIESDLQELLDFLPNCEYELISFMVTQKVWKGSVPLAPPDYSPGDGSVDLGLFLYWLNNPAQLDLSMFTLAERLEIDLLIAVLDETLASSLMTAENAAYFSTNELIYTDGGVLSTKKYATYDQGWFIAFLNLVETLIRDLWYYGEAFPSTKPPVITLTGQAINSVKIAILGDCGTGDAVLEGILKNITLQNPDYIIHVGDVYYAGTPSSRCANADKYFFPGEEGINLLKLWPVSAAGKSFTLNSNHEMYSGANGYFCEALGSRSSGVFFSAQQGSSCFALQCGGWTILGLDTAYMGSVTDAFMTGSIGGAGGTQGQWISSLKTDPAKTIVLTHHNGFEPDCSAVSPLWAEIAGALGGDPYAWYWGHVHNGIAYKSPITIPPTAKLPGLTTKTFARCLGHAALPYGPSPALDGKPILWKASNLKPASRELYNGFAMLTLSLNTSGQVNGILESFFDLSSRSEVWKNKVF